MKQSGEYVAAHVSQAQQTYERLMAAGGVESYRQQGDTVYFRTSQPAPTPPRRRSWRWLLWSVGAVAGLFAVAGLLKAGILAVATGAALFGLLLFGSLGLLVWKGSNRFVGFGSATVAGLLCAALMVAAVISAEPLWSTDAAARTQAIAAQCDNGDVGCRVSALSTSTERLIDVLNSPASDGFGVAVLEVLRDRSEVVLLIINIVARGCTTGGFVLWQTLKYRGFVILPIDNLLSVCYHIDSNSELRKEREMKTITVKYGKPVTYDVYARSELTKEQRMSLIQDGAQTIAYEEWQDDDICEQEKAAAIAAGMTEGETLFLVEKGS